VTRATGDQHAHGRSVERLPDGVKRGGARRPGYAVNTRGMTHQVQRITPFLWFDHEAEEAAVYYASIFDDARVLRKTYYSKEAAEASGRPEGSVMTVEFQLLGLDFTAINGGPAFKFTEAMSLVVNCNTQDEVDRYWAKLSAGGDPKAQQCGWLKDKYGVSWQVVPNVLPELIADPDPERARRATKAMLAMKKIDIEALRRAAEAA
jgi:predicted 3-demethylubiquinone-9 3-methyltransferase (glyoxalase superfamily)